MVSFKLGKEIEKDAFTKKNPSLFLFQAYNSTSFLFYYKNMMLLTLLILTVCRTGPCSP